MQQANELIDGMPRLIQAGMGVHISSAALANATSRLGALGVVSGAALRHIIVEDVRAGDADTIAFASTFPVARYVEELLAYAPGGARHRQAVPMDVPEPERAALPRRLSAISAYVEVMRARKGHRGKVGINVMWKCALTALPTIYGAMLAGVDALLCGAGVPMELPDIVRRIRAGENLEYSPLTGTGTNVSLEIAGDNTSTLLSGMQPPRMMPILSNFAFAKRMLDVWSKTYDGAQPFAFILENHKAGGHNAPPRNKEDFTEQDDLGGYFDKVQALGLPVYIAGTFPHGGTRQEFLEWLERGAYGIQVGSRFALCNDSGMRDDLRKNLIASNAGGETQVATSHRMSPTGYPIKYVPLPGTIGDENVYEARTRICNRGYLAQSHFEAQPDGTVKETYICAAMPATQYTNRGGETEDLEGRACLCNGLLSTAGYYDDQEAPLITLGASGAQITQSLTARDVMEDILSPEYVAAMERALRLETSQP